MSTEPSGPRAAQIQAVRDVMGWGQQPDTFNERAVADTAAELVDAVHAAGRDQDERVTPTERRGFGRRNPHCSNCGDERGGPFGHETSECAYRPGMTVGELVTLPHLAGREPEVWDHYVDRYFEHEPIRREAEARGWAKAVQALLDVDRYRAWWRQVDSTDDDFVRMPDRRALARYLEAVGPDGTPKLGVFYHDVERLPDGTRETHVFERKYLNELVEGVRRTLADRLPELGRATTEALAVVEAAETGQPLAGHLWDIAVDPTLPPGRVELRDPTTGATLGGFDYDPTAAETGQDGAGVDAGSGEACTCPQLDVSTFLDDPRNPPTVKGLDPNCPTCSTAERTTP
jgi:hypothetical protein